MERAMQQIARLVQESGAQSIEEMNRILDANLNGTAPPPIPAPQTDQERAMDLCYQAQESRARRAFQLVREALRLDPDCAQAYVQLARRESDPSAAEALYRKAVEAGRRTLGDEPFNDPEYPFWGVVETRPFMRAMAGLAEMLEAQERLDEAADVLREMLRLNSGDNQGMRYRYVPLLIQQGKLEEARAVIESEPYAQDASAVWEYSAALIAQRQGRREEADALLKRALRGNPYVPELIFNPDRMPPVQPDYWSPGDPSEAVMVADLLGETWGSDAASLAWLLDAARSAGKPRAKGRGSGKGRGPGKGKGGGRGRGKKK
jgi:tetratricopeptide (TPR) repeat protein